ncbi:MAG: nitroreductase family protein [Firmicutes bacterium]|nr:nitroreductase family protein [Bacillota bacterium]
MSRVFNHEIMPEIKSRWSPRAFSNKSIAADKLKVLLEAARYAPSCNNEQPWRFLVADSDEKLTKMRNILNKGNQEWANKAPVLILVIALKSFEKTGKENHWNMFDTGTAWGYLSLEAERQGLITHAMGGFDREKARSEFKIPEEYEIISVIAVGYYGDKSELSEFNQSRERPQMRNEIDEILI